MSNKNSARFIYQNEIGPRRNEALGENQEFNPYVFEQESGIEEEGTDFDIAKTPEEEQKLLQEHFRTNGYEVRNGDALERIIRNKFGKKAEYDMPVEYKSEKIPESKKPKTVGETNLIYAGQIVYWKGDKIVIADIPEESEGITEVENAPPMPIIEPEGEEDNEPEQREPEQGEPEKKYPKKEDSNREYEYEGGYEEEQETTNDVQIVEQKAAEEGIHLSPVWGALKELDGIDIYADRVKVLDPETGRMAIPAMTTLFGGDRLDITFFIDSNGNYGIADKNSDGIRYIKKGKSPEEGLKRVYEMAQYDGLASSIFRRNRTYNKNMEDFDRRIKDDDIQRIVETMENHYGTKMTPEKFKNFMNFWMRMAYKKAYTTNHPIELGKSMRQLFAKGEGMDSPISKQKVLEIAVLNQSNREKWDTEIGTKEA